MAEPKYPRDELLWVRYLDTEKNLRFIVTSRPLRDQYMLYELKDGKFVRLGKAASPVELEDQFNVLDKLIVSPLQDCSDEEPAGESETADDSIEIPQKKE